MLLISFKTWQIDLPYPQ